MAVTVALVVTELKMHRDLMEVKLPRVQTEIMEGPFLLTGRLKDNYDGPGCVKGHSMIFCNYQVRGEAGGEAFYPAEMVEKVEQEVSPRS